MYRVALWHPELISYLFSICTPYSAPSKHYVSLEDAVNTMLPQFNYQIHLSSGEVEKVVMSKEDIRRFLGALYGGRGLNGEVAFSPEKGVIFDNLPKIGSSPFLTEKVSYTYLILVYHAKLTGRLRGNGLLRR